VDVAPDGRSLNLSGGIVRACYRHFATGEAPSPIEPGRPYEHAIDLWATSNVFTASHRIGLHVTSRSFPRWDRNPNTGRPFGDDAGLRVAHQQNSARPRASLARRPARGWSGLGSIHAPSEPGASSSALVRLR
jgi:predicted acyl esterase